MTLQTLFEEAVRRKATDLHLASGEAPRLRIDGALVALEGAVDLPGFLQPFLTPDGGARLAAGLPVERTLEHGDLAFVGIAFRVGEQGLAATFRILRNDVPALDFVAGNALALFHKIMEAPKGLILIAGATGSGKWTTACSVVDAINMAKAARIFVVAAHPSFLLANRKSMVTHLHVGADVESYARALDIAQQADVDVIALDDLPTSDSLRLALALADTGRLVIANLNVRTAVEALTRLLESAGEEEAALRRALAENLLAVTAQRLVPGSEGKGRVALYEWIANGSGIKAALLQGGDLAEAQRDDPDCQTLEAAARELYAARKISAEDAMKYAEADLG